MSFHSVDPEGMFLLSEHVNPERLFLDDELRNIIFRTVENLPPRRKMIYKLIKDDGMKYKEVAALMEIVPKTVENHLDLAIKEIRQAVTKYLEGKKEKQTLLNIPQGIMLLCLLVASFFRYATLD